MPGDVKAWTVTLRAVPPGRDASGRDASYRLRVLLKRALRQYGLRCVAVTPVEKPPVGEFADPDHEPTG